MAASRIFSASSSAALLLWTSSAVLALMTLMTAGVQGISVEIINHCNGTMKLSDGANVTRIKENKSVTLELKRGDIRAYRYDAVSQATLAEFSIDKDNVTWFDISIIPTGPLGGPKLCASLEQCKSLTGGVGFNQPVQLNPKVDYPDANCRKLVCLEDGCADAYHFPQQDEKTHSCPPNMDFQVIFCPTTQDTESDWVDADGKLESGVVVGDLASTPTPAPAVSTDNESSTKAAPEESSSAAVYVASALGGTILVAVVVGVVIRYRQRVVASVQYHWPDRKSSDAMSFVSAKDVI